LSIHGLQARPGIDAPLYVASHGTAHARFSADSTGTSYYWGTLGKQLEEHEGRDRDSELTGALIVDGPGARIDDRIFIISRHDSANEGGDGVGAWAINGRSWPQTERLSYAVGEPVVWRWINATGARHPMHLHGMFFRVTSSGDNMHDVPRTYDQQNDVVTQTMRPASTMAMTWRAPHAGNWLFHCHIMFHVMPENRIPEPLWYDDYATLQHDQHMAGLVLGIHVSQEATADRGNEPASPRHRDARRRAPRRELRRVLQAARARRRLCDRRLAGQRAGTRARARARRRRDHDPQRSDQRDIRALARHRSAEQLLRWCAALGRRRRPRDARGSIPTAASSRVSRRRAGTFMYRTHFNDYAQLTAAVWCIARRQSRANSRTRPPITPS
jgi:hypothetical protein